MAEAVDALAVAPAVLALSSPKAVVTMVTGMNATSDPESVVVSAVVVNAVSNEVKSAEASVAIRPAGPTYVSAQTAAVVPLTAQSRTTDVLSKDSSACNVDGPTVTVIASGKPQSSGSASVGHAMAMVVLEAS